MKNRKLLLIVSLALAMMMSLGGTLAYLTDTDGQVNVMTVGNVKVELNELQRNDDQTALEEFEQGKVAMPYVNASEKDTTFNLIKEKSHIDKIVYATNTGKSDAYMRILVAIPAWANTTDNQDNANDNNLHWNYPGDTTSSKIQQWLTEHKNVVFDENANQYSKYKFERLLAKEEDTYPTVTIGGKEYTVWAFTFNNAIAAGKSTNIVLTGLYLDKRVDYDADTDKYLDINGKPIENFDGTIYVPVLVQAVQASGFDTADAALKEAFGEKTVDNAETWFGSIGLVNAAPENGATRPSGYGTDAELLAKENPVIDGIVVEDNSDETTNLRALYAGDGKTFKGTLTVKNSYLDGTYAMNAIGDETGNLVVENTALRGWVSYDGFNSASFTNCSFGMNSNPEYYNVIRPYSAVTFTNCEFNGTDFWLDKMGNANITFVNCTMNGELIDDVSDITVVHEGGNVVVSNTNN